MADMNIVAYIKECLKKEDGVEVQTLIGMAKRHATRLSLYANELAEQLGILQASDVKIEPFAQTMALFEEGLDYQKGLYVSDLSSLAHIFGLPEGDKQAMEEVFMGDLSGIKLERKVWRSTVLSPLFREDTRILVDMRGLLDCDGKNFFLTFLPALVGEDRGGEAPGVMLVEIPQRSGRKTLMRVDGLTYGTVAGYAESNGMKPCPGDPKNNPDRTLVFMM